MDMHRDSFEKQGAWLLGLEMLRCLSLSPCSMGLSLELAAVIIQGPNVLIMLLCSPNSLDACCCEDVFKVKIYRSVCQLVNKVQVNDQYHYL